MTTYKASGPFFLRDGSPWCARCKRTRLERAPGTRRFDCPLCDRGEDPDATEPEATLVGGEIRCGKCGVNVMLPTGPDGALECPGCDLPPWERHRVTSGVHVQETLGGEVDALAAQAAEATPDRPAKPSDLVLTCFCCFQATVHTAWWDGVKWRRRCTACGGRLQPSRLKVSRADKRRGGP